MELEQPQSKRTRRPSVRLGGIGELGFSAPWLESRSERKQQQEQQEQQEQQHPVEEEWSVVEPVVGKASPVVFAPASTPTGKRRSGRGFLRWTGSKVRGRHKDDATVVGSEPSPGNGADDDDDDAPFRAVTSSDSDRRGLKEHPVDDSGNGANPNSHGDEMQGAIEDGPNGTGFRTGERRSGRQVARRKHHVASRETVSKDTTAGEPAAAPVDNGTAIVSPSSSQRITPSAGVSGWLQELGLGKYAELFEINEVDTEVLPLLTMEDLREMGVDAVGARRKMFSNILAIRGG